MLPVVQGAWSGFPMLVLGTARILERLQLKGQEGLDGFTVCIKYFLTVNSDMHATCRGKGNQVFTIAIRYLLIILLISCQNEREESNNAS